MAFFQEGMERKILKFRNIRNKHLGKDQRFGDKSFALPFKKKQKSEANLSRLANNRVR